MVVLRPPGYDIPYKVGALFYPVIVLDPMVSSEVATRFLVARSLPCFPSPQQARKVMDSVKGKYNRPIATECKDATVYWPAEVWHRSVIFFHVSFRWDSRPV